MTKFNSKLNIIQDRLNIPRAVTLGWLVTSPGECQWRIICVKLRTQESRSKWPILWVVTRVHQEVWACKVTSLCIQRVKCVTYTLVNRLSWRSFISRTAGMVQKWDRIYQWTRHNCMEWTVNLYDFSTITRFNGSFLNAEFSDYLVCF